jgi:phosphatidylglycerophosphate synthase
MATLNAPNTISMLRIALAPVLLWLAWTRQPAFAFVLALSLMSDILDGYLARRLNQQTRLGAQLDSWGDFLTVLIYLPAALWLRPVELRHSAPYVAVAVASYFLPIVLGFAKYHRLTSYHTRLMTVTAYAMGIAIVCFFAGWSAIPFRGACVLLLIASIEEIMITTALPDWLENVRSYRAALLLRKSSVVPAGLRSNRR